MLEGVRAVGFGEATHGTKEFYEYKLQMLRHLVTETGFNIVAIEGSHSSAQVINDYVLNGTGNEFTALAELGHVMWDVEEFAETLRWLRAHNRSVADSEKVRFKGLDMWHTRVGRARVLNYFQTVLPENAAAVEELFRTVARGERQGMLLAYRSHDRRLFQRICDLSDTLASNRGRCIEMTSPDEYEYILREMAVIRQWVACNITDELPDEHLSPVPRMTGLNNFARSIYMAHNLIDLLGRAGPDARIVIWAHAFHVGIGFHDDVRGEMQNMGSRLRACLGDQYYAFAMEFYRGKYLAREMLPDQTLGDHKIGTVPPAPESSLAWYLSMAGSDQFMLDLRNAACGQAIEEWLTRPRQMHCAGWAHSDPPPCTTMTLKASYDGVVFIKETSATTPTTNALLTVSKRAAH